MLLSHHENKQTYVYILFRMYSDANKLNVINRLNLEYNNTVP
jgi:hypothetical protein